ncbi:MAG: type VI secretion system protein TssA [Chitinophagaceae bacterium]|nr:type VI secretion system protein TssA [Rubrivivax sp.]
MANEPIDLAPLLAPLEIGEQGAGADLRLDYSAVSSYQKLRDARSAARADERARDSDDDSDGPPAEGWRDVLSIGQHALATQSKDMEVAAWLTEALVRMHGLAGLAAGATLLARLCDAYWETGFPQPDEDGMEVRASPIGGLSGSSSDGTVMQPLRRLAMFRRTDGTGLGLYQWEQAEQTAALPDERREAKIAAGAPDLKVLETEARVDKAYLTGTWRGATAALAAWRELDQIAEARFGSEAPSLRKVTTLLEQMLAVVTRLGGEPPAAELEAAATADGADAGDVAGASHGTARGAVLTREDALRELDRLADYFKRTEPHSPLAYTLEDAVRRGRLSLAELLAEVLPDEDARNAMLSRLGIRPNSN